MDKLTRLDQAHAAMIIEPEDETARLRFYECLATTELFLALKEEPVAEVLNPDVISVEGADYVMVFDTAERLASFMQRPCPYASVIGRDISLMLASGKLGLAVNPDVAPSSILIPARGVAWLAEMSSPQKTAVAEAVRFLSPPSDADNGFLAALRDKLDRARGLADAAYLVKAEYDSGDTRHILAFVDAVPAARQELTRWANETVVFYPDAVELDVGFFSTGESLCAEIISLGKKFDMKIKHSAETSSLKAPGMDPDQPPNLR